jgi:hypothetical protein
VIAFADLAASRRKWIDTVLKPWCAAAPRSELRKAHAEWANIAGNVDPEATLWTWAWGRFPDLVHEDLAGVNETSEVRVTLCDGTDVTGYPDARLSTLGELVLLGRDDSGRSIQSGPHPLDDIVRVERL